MFLEKMPWDLIITLFHGGIDGSYYAVKKSVL